MVIGASLWGLVSDAGGGVNVLRLFRAIRVLKLVRDTLRKVWNDWLERRIGTRELVDARQ